MQQTLPPGHSDAWRSLPTPEGELTLPPADEPDEAEAIVELGYN
ncbi:hypothetical protein [Rheinheimera sp.]